MPVDLGLQLELAIRLLVAAALGAAVGVEREIHEHPAGMRTHLLVALGSAIFTELSIFGFVDVLPGRAVAAPDPTRIAAQIVSGIGFLGAGAILKYGTSIRGLTTAASLWAVAAIGLASGAGAWVVAGVGAIIVIFSLWPLNRLALRLRGQGRRLIHLRLVLSKLEVLGAVSRELVSHGVEIVGIQSQRLGKGRYEVDLDLRFGQASAAQAIIAAVGGLPDVEQIEAVREEE
ncbi:MAG: MgtC/SapB family protein [Candidatus Limnocylindrales bacterium]